MENYANADGFIDDDMNFSGGDFFSNAGGHAYAGGGMGSIPTSQPYIITVTSATGVSSSNFEVLGSYEYVNNAGFSNGSLTISGVTIASGIANITYQEMLYQFMQNPFSVGLTYYQSGTTNQVLETVSVNTRDANGNEAQKTLVPTVDPYQQQSDIVAMRYGYRIDGFTKLIIRNILANATVKIYMYPSDNINLARGLSGSPVSKQFGNPGVIQAQPIALKG